MVSTVVKRGKCSVCGFSQRVTLYGAVVSHKVWIGRDSHRCDGSLRSPKK